MKDYRDIADPIDINKNPYVTGQNSMLSPASIQPQLAMEPRQEKIHVTQYGQSNTMSPNRLNQFQNYIPAVSPPKININPIPSQYPSNDEVLIFERPKTPIGHRNLQVVSKADRVSQELQDLVRGDGSVRREMMPELVKTPTITQPKPKSDPEIKTALEVEREFNKETHEPGFLQKMPNYADMAAEDKIQHHLDYGVMFGKLTRDYSYFNIPARVFSDDMPLPSKYKYYIYYYNQVKIENSVARYELYLRLFFFGTHLVLNYWLKWDMPNFYKDQIDSMKRYYPIIRQMGNTAGGFGEGMSPMTQLVTSIGVQTLIIVAAQLACQHLKSPQIGNMVKSVAQNFVDTMSNDTPIDTGTGTGIPMPQATDNSMGGLLNMVQGLMGGLGQMGAQGQQAPQQRPQQQYQPPNNQPPNNQQPNNQQPNNQQPNNQQPQNHQPQPPNTSGGGRRRRLPFDS